MNDALASGTYEILRNRLRDAAGELRERFEQLNSARSEVFGNIETRLIGTAHVSTDHNCTPRDLLAVADRLLLGYNVQFGLRTDIGVQDVFTLYRLEGDIAHTLDLAELFDERSRRDFSELYRYYKHTSFSRFYSNGPNIYFVFQVGKLATDIKAFKWVVEGNGLRYIDNRSEHEVRAPAQLAFAWKRTTREQHRSGLHPHISIEDLLFVECVGGDLTIKVEDNTQDGSGVYSEPVEHRDQTLDDAEIFYCILNDLVLLKIRPYQEKSFRHLVFCRKQCKTIRLDAMEHACILLPQDQGIIFPGGFVLQTGEYKLFDHGYNHLMVERTIPAPNGEDFLYIFADLLSGIRLHLRYNVIRQAVDTPLICHGQTVFDNGQMITFRAQEHPQRHHALQIWQTPFVGPNFQVNVATDSMLYKIGNRDLVQCMAECQQLLALIDKEDNYEGLYVDLSKRSTDILDSYHWIGRAETFSLNQPLEKIRDAAHAATEEFEKVIRVRRETEQAVAGLRSTSDDLLKSIQRSNLESVEQFVSMLAGLREKRGHAIGLREMRYVDLQAVEAMERDLAEATGRLGQRCVQFLLTPASLQPYQIRIQQALGHISGVQTAAQGRDLQSELSTIGSDLELLIETISQLKIDDLTQRTAIVDRTGNMLAELNRVRSSLSTRLRELLSGEMEADFASQTRLLDQAAAGALETADTPEKVDEALTRMMLQLEELEGRFAEFEHLVGRLTEKRESLYGAFESRRMQLVEARSRRADSLVSAADRILQGIATRALRLSDADALRAYLAADAMVDKVRQIAGQLQSLGDTVRMDDILSRLKAVGDDSLRQLRDRQELSSGIQDAIRLGKHLFNVNLQPIELTTVARQGQIQLHLTGTQFFQALQDPALEEARDLWDQLLPGETPHIYRAEFLAFLYFSQLLNANLDLTLDQFLSATDEQRVHWLREFMQQRHDEGYARGVHDHDAAAIVSELVRMERNLGLLKYSPHVRGLAHFAWYHIVPQEETKVAERWIQSLWSVTRVLPKTRPGQGYVELIARLLQQHAADLFKWEAPPSGETRLSGKNSSPEECQADSVIQAANFLFERFRQLSKHEPVEHHPIERGPVEREPVEKGRFSRVFMASRRAIASMQQLNEHLPQSERTKLNLALSEVDLQPLAAWRLALDAVDGYLRALQPADDTGLDPVDDYRCELAALMLDQAQATQDAKVAIGSEADPAVEISGLAGDHPRLNGGKLQLHYHRFVERLKNYQQSVLPRFHALRATKHRLLAQADKELRTSEFKARVLTSFVRNKLIDEVYLPLVGNNLAKQLGAAGENKRSDRMGLLLLISPPGYGKTTLMEYIANRLGLVFVKVNGPALGHRVTSLDPAEATNASAREEVNRINLALEMGDNVMLYLDDIQHCNPELLQKFIPLCDATRRIEGIWRGQPKTYDLRGRKFAVVMAGNPYTESGERFQIPDMLSNRADIYNLGEIIGDSQDAFELSYIENCLASNNILQPLAGCSSQDQWTVIRAAQLGSASGIELQANLAADQVHDMVQVISKLLTVRDIVLRVNRAYIRSAAQNDAYRTEPPFKLQGSYRNMNRIAERVVPLMNDAELQTLVISGYEQDAQTLTRDGEANLLKFKEIMGVLTSDETTRWENIKYAYVEGIRMQGIEGDDQTAQVLRTMVGLRDGLESIRRTLSQAIASDRQEQGLQVLQASAGQIAAGLNALGQHLSETIQLGSQRLETSAKSVPDQKVLVQHSVPRVMTDLIESQFQLLYDGLRPVLEASAASKSQLEALQKSMDTCIQRYQALQDEVRKSK
jgi:hypothetical protein